MRLLTGVIVGFVILGFAAGLIVAALNPTMGETVRLRAALLTADQRGKGINR